MYKIYVYVRESQCYRRNRYEKHTRLCRDAKEAKQNELIHDEHKF